MSKIIDDWVRAGIFGQKAADDLKQREEAQRAIISRIPVRKPTGNFYSPPAERCPCHDKGDNDGR